MIAETYPATVTSIDDPEKRGRIKVTCAGILGDEETELPMFIAPVHQWGWFFIPDVGESVEIEVVTSGDEDEQFGQSSINNLDIKWRGARYHTDAELEESINEPRPVHSDFTAEAYGKRRGFATPMGHVMIFDDTEKAPRIYLTMMTEKLDPPDSTPDETKFTRVEIEPDGSIKFGALAKQVFHLQTEGNQLLVTLDEEKHKFALDANGPSFTVELDGAKYSMKLDSSALEVKLNGATLKSEGMGPGAKLTVGNGAMHVAIAETLQILYETLKANLTLFANHIHPTGVGPSGTPLPPLVVPPWNAAIKSTKVSIPNG